MNLKGRYDMVRQASLQLVGLPTDNIDELKALAETLRVVAMVDAGAAVSLLMLQTLIVTHAKPDALPLLTYNIDNQQNPKLDFDLMLQRFGANVPLPPGRYSFSAQFDAQPAGYIIHKVSLIPEYGNDKRD